MKYDLRDSILKATYHVTFKEFDIADTYRGIFATSSIFFIPAIIDDFPPFINDEFRSTSFS